MSDTGTEAVPIPVPPSMSRNSTAGRVSRLRRGATGSHRQRKLPRRRSIHAQLAAALLAVLVGITSCGRAPIDDDTSAAPSVSAEKLAQIKATAKVPPCPQGADLPIPSADLPDKTLPCLGGGSAVNLAALRGPYVINVWAQWCGPCREEAPYLREASRRLQKSGVRFMGINYMETRPDWALEFAGLERWTYPQLEATDRNDLQQLRIFAPPQTIFVDKAGKVRFIQRGAFKDTEQILQTAATAFDL